MTIRENITSRLTDSFGNQHRRKIQVNPESDLNGQAGMLDDDDPPCLCVRIDVDCDDNRGCPAHGPSSESAKRLDALEAEDEAKAAARLPYLLGVDPKELED